MSQMPPRAHGVGVQGIFVLGAYGSGLEIVRDALCALGLERVESPADEEPGAVGDFDDRLLAVVGGSRYALPNMAPVELGRRLEGLQAEARRLVAGGAAGTGATRPWVWADPRNSVLASFWAEALGAEVACVYVHRDPAHTAAALKASDPGWADPVGAWDQYNRAAVVQCSQRPFIALRYDEVVNEPYDTACALTKFVESCGIAVDADTDRVAEVIERHEARSEEVGAFRGAISAQHRVLDRVLDRLSSEGSATADGEDHAGELIDAVATFYGEDYYGSSYDRSGIPYRRDEKHWVDFFDSVAQSIVDSINPRTALDAGCAIGMLVEALRARGVDARGVDVSAWAINQVPDSLRPYCAVGSITDDFDGHYDLITCIEVMEHLPPTLASAAIGNLTRHADAVLFCSTPDDFDEPTHLNVEPTGFWASRFFEHGFTRDVDFDASFLAPHAVLFRRRPKDAERLIIDYERGLANSAASLRDQLQHAVEEHDRVAARYNETAVELRSLTDRHTRDVERLRLRAEDAERRRTAEVLAAMAEMRTYEASQRRLAALVAHRESELQAVWNTKTFRYTAKLRRIYGRARRRPVAPEPATFLPEVSDGLGGSYELWVEQYDTVDDATRRVITERLSGLARHPLISVVMPVYNPAEPHLRAAIESVTAQLYPHWELCIADDASTDPAVAGILAEYEAADPRVKVVRRPENGHISAACNAALAMASGEWVTCVDQDDVLAEHALALAAEALDKHPQAGLVYSDEDKIDESGRRHTPFFKTEYDPVLLLGQNFMNHMTLLRRDLVTEVGGYREGYEGSQDWDLALRVSEKLGVGQVVHLPHVLYHWRAHAGSTAALIAAKPYAVDAGARAVTEHLARTSRPGHVVPIPRSGHNRVTWELPPDPPLVSIVIPTRDGSTLQRCVDSLFAFTTYPRFEIFVIDNSSSALPTLQYLRAQDSRVTVFRDEQPFNYSAINNLGVRRTSGDVICLLNDDTEVISGDWLSEMVGNLLQPGVGAVGAKLYYSDGRIQHAGIVLGILGVAGHSHRTFDRLDPGYFNRLHVAQSVSAVTGACAVVRREAWDAVGGLDEGNLPIAFNDVDFCLRLWEAGWRVVWTPHAELFHHESVTRGPDDGPRASGFAREIHYMQRRWGPVLRRDPWYSPNLSLDCEDFSLAWPPRVSYR